MDHLQRVLILLMVVGIPAASPPTSPPHSDLCFDAGSLTYRISQTGSSADLRVKIDPQASHPDLRLQLVDDVTTADFTMVDDESAAAAVGCRRSSASKAVRIVTDSSPADLTVALSAASGDPALRLYVHSARFGSHEVAALYAAIRYFEHLGAVSDSEAENQEASW